MFLTLIDTRFLSLCDAYKYLPLQSCQFPVDNFREENGKKIGQSDFCWKYISFYVTFPWSYSLP